MIVRAELDQGYVERIGEIEADAAVDVRPQELTLLGCQRLRRCAWMYPRHRYSLQLPPDVPSECVPVLEALRAMQNVRLL